MSQAKKIVKHSPEPNQHTEPTAWTIHAYNREGERFPQWHVFVRHSPEFLGSESALMGVHWLYKLWYWLNRRSRKEWTEEEIRTVKMTLKIMNERGDRKYNDGFADGFEKGEEHAIKMLKLMQAKGFRLDGKVTSERRTHA